MTLSEFDRLTRGYHRRNADAWRRTRLQVVTLLNLNRGEKDPEIIAEKWLPLYGDVEPTAPPVLSPEEIEAQFAHVSSLDTDW